MSQIIIRVAGFVETSASDGPGLRSVLFLQGCNLHCPGCQNQDLQPANGGVKQTLPALCTFLVEHCKNRKLTISGGEPLEQLTVLVPLLEELHRLSFDLCVYTGWMFEQVPEPIRKAVHWLKVGRFEQDCITHTKPFVGSNNQEMLELNAKGEKIRVL